MKLINIKQKTKDWLQWRRNKITASDASTVVGVNPYKKLDKLYDEKIRCYEMNITPAMQRGLDLESLALREFERETGLVMFTAVGQHDELDWMAASFDGMTIEGDAIVEIKCNGNKAHSLAEEGKIQDFHLAQIQHQLHVAGIDLGFYYSFTGDKGIILEVKRDQDFIDLLIEKEFEFWQCLQNLTPPTPIQKARRKKNAIGAIPSNV